MEIAQSSCENVGINICSDSSSELEYTDNVVLLSEDPVKLQVFYDSLKISVCMFGMLFGPRKCKVVLQDWIGL